MEGSVYIGNRGGVPIVTATPQVNTSNVIIALPNHIFRFLGQRGVIIVNLTAAIPSSTTTTLAVVAEVNGQTMPLDNPTGAALTVSDLSATLTFEIYFDKTLNVLRVLSTII